MKPECFSCPICSELAPQAVELFGRFSNRAYHLHHCPGCRFTFVADPFEDYASLYNMDYYSGRGADPYVNYLEELEHPESTIRHYEWRGILQIVTALLETLPGRMESARWLDFGCGNGGLVRYARQQGWPNVVGYDKSIITEHVRQHGIPVLTDEELSERSGEFDVVTAIEVLEHVPDPMEELRRIRALLKPGGILFLTTGNARPHRGHWQKWAYVVPEIHVSYFEPETLALALSQCGFSPRDTRGLPGWPDIIRFKILKTLKVRQHGLLESLLPWGLLARLADQRYQITNHPAGISN